MRLSRRHNLVATVVLVAALFAVGLMYACSDGLHVGMGGMDRKCLTMTHTTIIGTEASQDWAPVLLAQVLGIVLGTGIVLASGWRLRPAVVVGASPPSPPDPLMGRLRI